jgi:hypothetical protein
VRLQTAPIGVGRRGAGGDGRRPPAGGGDNAAGDDPRTDLVRRIGHQFHRNVRHIPHNRSFHTVDGLLLPYGRPALDEEGHVRLPTAFTRTGCHRIEVCRIRNARSHFLAFDGIMAEFTGLSGLLNVLCTHAPRLWSTVTTLRRLVVPRGADGAAGGVRLCLAHDGVDPRAAHAVVCAALVLFNPLTLLDEVVALGVAIGMLVYGDNRTMCVDDLVLCESWHRACFVRVMPRCAAPWTPAEVRLHGRGRVRVPSPPPPPPPPPPTTTATDEKKRATGKRRRKDGGGDDGPAATATARALAMAIMSRHRRLAAQTLGGVRLDDVPMVRRQNAWDAWSHRRAFDAPQRPPTARRRSAW